MNPATLTGSRRCEHRDTAGRRCLAEADPFGPVCPAHWCEHYRTALAGPAHSKKEDPRLAI